MKYRLKEFAKEMIKIFYKNCKDAEMGARSQGYENGARVLGTENDGSY